MSALNILEGYDLESLGDRTPASMHLITEAYRRAYMDRSDYLGDPDYNNIPVAGSPQKNTQRRGAPAFCRTRPPRARTLQAARGLPAARAQDRRRAPRGVAGHHALFRRRRRRQRRLRHHNAQRQLRFHVTAGSLGFLLNDEMDDFASKLGVPNMFGLIQGPANAIAPGKRPLSSMTPTIVLENGKLRYVLGSPGGARIITTVAGIFLSAAEGGLNIQEAVDAPRFHHQYQPDKLYLEPGISA